MRNGQNKRMRGRNRRGHNPLTRVYESNGPDVKIRGTAHHIAEKYLQLARDAQASGDPIAAESYYQHAEHYFRLIAAAQAQFQPQQQPHQHQHPHQHQQHHQQPQPYQRPDESGDDEFDGEEVGGPEQSAAPYQGAQPQQQFHRPQHQPQPQPMPQPQPQPNYQGHPQREPGNARETGLPAFITGGAPGQGGNGYDNDAGDRDGGRFGRRRRRFRPRGPGDYDQRQSGDYEARPDVGDVSSGPAEPQHGEGPVPIKPAEAGE